MLNMETLLFNPVLLVTRAKNVAGFDMLDSKLEDKSILYTTALEVAEEWTTDWPEGQGFGTSDTTFSIKDFIDRIIQEIGGGFHTDFVPCLTVIKD